MDAPAREQQVRPGQQLMHYWYYLSLQIYLAHIFLAPMLRRIISCSLSRQTCTPREQVYFLARS